MPNPSLDALRPTLLAIPLEDVKVPHIPPKVTHQEAEALLIFVQKPDHLPLFDRLGLSPQVASATLALQASREAQSLWTTARDANKPEAQKAREDDGYTLRAEILAACDWNLRADEAALRVLARIREGEGVADLVADLEALALLCEQNSAAFAADQTFALAERVEQAKSLALDISQGLARFQTEISQSELLDLRNRAWTHLQAIVAELRQGGRYLFRNEPKLLSHFFSAFEQRRGRAMRRSSDPA